MKVSKRIVKSHDGYNIYYEVHGLDSAKSVIFFVHGAGGDVDAWQFIRERLIEKNFGAVSMDLRGHGYSAHPRNPGAYEIRHLVADVIAILDQEQIDKIILVGHSYGAVVAAHFAIEHPERLEKLVIISGSHSSPNYLKSKILKKLSNGVIHVLAFLSPPQVKPWHSPYPKGKVHKDYEAYGLTRTIFYNSWGSYLLTSKQSVNLDIRNKLSKITTETLVIVGSEDSIFSHHVSHQIHKEIPNSKFEIIQGANHVIVLNNPDETVRLIENFLNP